MSQTQAMQLGHKGFWAICLTVLMIAYNVGVMPAIMPRIVHDFNSSVGQIQSILVVFSLTTASFAPTTENLCRFYGRTPVFLAGLILYGIGIGMTALSPSIAMLAVSFAVVTGLAATPLVSTPWTIADLVYAGKAQEQALAAMVVSSALGGLSGALLGGFLASRLGWRWAFLPSLAIWLLIWLLQRSLPRLMIRCEQPIDWFGGLLSFLGLSSILIGVSLASEFGWWEPKRVFAIGGVVLPPFPLSIVPTLIAVGAILLGFFSFWQRRQADRGLASLLRAGLLRKRGFVLGMLTAMLHTLIVTGVQFNLYQYVPVALSLNPFDTALTIIPYNITMIIVVVVVLKVLLAGDQPEDSAATKRFSAKLVSPKSLVYAGLILLASGLLTVYYNLNLQTGRFDLMPGLILMGMGSGLFSSCISKLAYATASAHEKPEGSGIYHPILNLGTSLGRAILGSSLIFFASRDIVDGILANLGKTLAPADRVLAITTLQEMLQTVSRDEVGAMFKSQLPPSMLPFLRQISLEAVTAGMKATLVLALVFTGICCLLAATLPKLPARRS
jgi:MFS family permease